MFFIADAPIWIVKPPDKVDVFEGSDVVITATAAANPGRIT